MRPGSVLARVPAPALFVGSGLAQYGGAAIAVGLFAAIPAPGLAWLRILVAAALLVGWRRPWRLPWSRHDLVLAAAFGVALGSMNVAFYVAIEHLPLGTAVAIEFVGPVAVAAITGSGWRERSGIGLAAIGVVLLAGVTLRSDAPGAAVGLTAIGVAAAAWAAYIVLGRMVAVRGDGVTRLSVAMAAAALIGAPFLAARAAPVLGDWHLVAAVFGVAVLSSVLPYAVEQVVLRRVGPAAFAVLLALLPATAAVVGAVALRQWPHAVDLAGLLLVSAAIAVTAPKRRTRAVPTTAGTA